VMYSARHDQMIDAMVSEMLRYAGFQDSVNARLRHISATGNCSDVQARWVDDLYEIYGGRQVLE
jgi:hypothetical protein